MCNLFSINVIYSKELANTCFIFSPTILSKQCLHSEVNWLSQHSASVQVQAEHRALLRVGEHPRLHGLTCRSQVLLKLEFELSFQLIDSSLPKFNMFSLNLGNMQTALFLLICQTKQKNLLKYDLLLVSFLVQLTGSVGKTFGHEKSTVYI